MFLPESQDQQLGSDLVPNDLQTLPSGANFLATPKESKEPIFSIENLKSEPSTKKEGEIKLPDLPALQKKASSASFFQLFHFIERREAPLLIFSVFFSLAQGGMLPLFSLVMGDLTVSFSPENSAQESTDMVQKQFLNLIYFGLGVLVSGFIASMLWNKLSGQQTKRIKLVYFKRLLEQDSSWFDCSRPDELSSNFIEQIASFSAAFSTNMHLLLMNAAGAVSGVAIAFAKGWLLAVFLILLSPVMLLGMHSFVRALRKSEELQFSSYAKAGSTAEEDFSLIKAIKSLNGEEHEIRRYAGHCEAAKKASVRFGYWAGLFWGLSFWSILALFSMGFLIASRLISNRWFNANNGRDYEVGAVLSVFYCVITSVFAIVNLGPLLKAMEAAKVAIRLILSFIREDRSEKSGSFVPAEVRGRVVFEGVSFSYPSSPNKKILDNVSFSIEPGQNAAFVGPSGSGKSTVVQLLERFYDPTGGRILLDGVELQEYNLKALRKRIGLVTQQPILFADSIRNNILKGIDDRGKITDDQVWETLRKVSASDFVGKLGRKLDQYVGSQGGQLSGGQKQRIAIARALIRAPSLFVFDEATSALDRKNEKEVQRTLEQIAKGKTTLTIAHRLSTVINSDVIFVLEKGKIVAKGTHGELMQDEKGLYKNLVSRQLQGEENETEGKNEDKEVLKESFDPPNKVNEQQQERQNSSAYRVNSQHLSGSKSFGHRPHLNPMHLRAAPVFLNQEVASFAEIKSGKQKKNSKEANTDQKSKEKTKKIGLMDFLKDEKRLSCIGILMAGLHGVVLPVYGVFQGSIVDKMTTLGVFRDSDFDPATGQTRSEVVHQIDLVIIAMSCMTVGAFFFSALNYSLFNQIGERFTFALRMRFFRRVMYQDLSYFDSEDNKPGLIAARLAIECRTINTLITTYLGSIFQSVAGLLAGVLIGLFFNWRIALVMLAMTPLFFIAGVMETQTASTNIQAKGREERGDILSETLANIKTVRCLTAQDEFLREFELAAERQRRQAIRTSWLKSFLFAFSQFSMFLVYAIIYRVGVIFKQNYGSSNLDFFIVTYAIDYGAFSAGMASQFVGGLGKAKEAARKILAELNSRPLIERDPFSLNPKADSTSQLKTLESVGEIKFKGVEFRYAGREERVFGGLSLSIPPGKSVAFVGSSGSGKSTILQLLMRFYQPQQGAILIDGVDVRDLDLSHLRSLFGVVWQEPQLFNGTIAYNLRYNRPEISEEQMKKACVMANAFDFIAENPEGFEREVGARGDRLSGGQRQRLAIARAILREPKVFLFDEATSALDSNSEAAIQQAIEQLSKEKASISIAHRLSTIRNCDRIFMLEAGRLVEEGGYDELMERRGRFFDLAHN